MRLVTAWLLAMLILCAGALCQEAPPPVSIQTKADAEVYAWIGPEGGKLDLTTEDGTAYALVVPAGALISPEYITMRPVESVEGLPGKGPIAGGVSFEPKGLEFVTDATLRITPAKPEGKTDVPMAWAYEGLGARPWATVVKTEGKTYVYPVGGFSGVIVRREPAKSFTDQGFTKEVDAATDAAAEETTIFRDDTGLGEATKDAQDAEDAAIKQYNDTAEMLAARARAQRALQELPIELSRERACQLLGVDCNNKLDILKLKEDVEKGLVPSLLGEMGRPGTTCERAREINRTILGFERQWQLLGASDGSNVIAILGKVPVIANGKVVNVGAFERTGQLCKKEAIQACKEKGDVPGLIRMILGMERQRQLLGMDPSEATRMTLDLAEALDCADPAIERCYARGDPTPLMSLKIAARMVAGSEDDIPEATRKRAQEIDREVTEALGKCARYKLAWTSKASSQQLLPGDAIGRTEVDARYEAELSFHLTPSDDPFSVGGIISGSGDAVFSRCESKLIKATDFLSQEYKPPCTPSSKFTVFVKELGIGDGKVPGRLVLRGSLPVAWVTWRTCWKYTGCSESQTIAGGTDTYLTYQFGSGEGAKTVGEFVAPKPLKEGTYPILFKDTISAKTKIIEADYEDVSEITFEHIGKR
jgi:hypothetical protein